MQNKNECLSHSTYFEIDLCFLSQDIENLKIMPSCFFWRGAPLSARSADTAAEKHCPKDI
jgi:hypothetical protein